MVSQHILDAKNLCFLYFRFVLKGAAYNFMDVIKCLINQRGYSIQGAPQQRYLPGQNPSDDKYGNLFYIIILLVYIFHISKTTFFICCFIWTLFRVSLVYHLSKDLPLRSSLTVPVELQVPIKIDMVSAEAANKKDIKNRREPYIKNVL